MHWLKKICYKEPKPTSTRSIDVGRVIFPTRGRINAKTSVVEKTWGDYAAISICHHLELAYQQEYTITLWGESIDYLHQKIDAFLEQNIAVKTTNPKNDWETTALIPVPWRAGHTFVQQRRGLSFAIEMEYAQDLVLALRVYRGA